MVNSDLSLERYGAVRNGANQRYGFFLTPTFAMLPFISVVEALRAANRFSEKRLYSWHFISENGQPVIANNGMEIPADYSIGSADSLPVVFICGPHEPNTYQSNQVFAWLRKQALNNTILGALDTGSYLLAQAGLLDGHRCTVHWENRAGMQETFPRLEISGELFEVDGKRWTCAGGTAAMDMMLYLIGLDYGHRLTAQIAELFIRDKIRHAHDPQRMDLRARTGISHPRLLECVALMEANVEQPLAPSELADMIGVSKRQVERLFKRYLHSTPSHYYLSVRLNAAKHLLEQTSMPIIDVAMACGFSSPGHFSHRFRTHFGHSPRQTRTVATESAKVEN